MNKEFIGNTLTSFAITLSALTAYGVQNSIVTWEESIILWGLSLITVVFVCISNREI